MKKFSAITWLRILGCLTVVHAAGLFLGLRFLFKMEDGTPRLGLLWVGLATLWFLWPIVLALHSAQSARRALIPLGVAAPFVFFWFQMWSSIWGPEAFGLPEFTDLTPLGVARWASSYVSGWVEGKIAVHRGDFVLEGYGFGFWAPRAPKFTDEQRKQCGIKLNAVAMCIVDTHIVSHARGWNDAMMSGLRRRCPDVVKAAEEEDARFKQSFFEGQSIGECEAKEDVQAGRLAIEMPQHPTQTDAQSEQELRDRYQIGLRRVYPWADEKLANWVAGHENGYNRVTEKEITRRYGKERLNAIYKVYFDNQKRVDSD